MKPLDTAPGQGRVTISCLVSDLIFRWQLRAAGEETDIDVLVELPETEAHRLPAQRALLESSIRALADLAAQS